MQTKIQAIKGWLTKSSMAIRDHGFDLLWSAPLKQLNG
jgi:hypothetical protein